MAGGLLGAARDSRPWRCPSDGLLTLHPLFVSDVYFPRVNGVSTSIRSFRQDLARLGHASTLVAPDYQPAPAPRRTRKNVLRVAVARGAA